jgi:capsular exopolysaccharide synthesis family protein
MMDNDKKTPNKFQSLDFHIDITRIIGRLVRHWYIVLLSVVIAMSIAYYKSRFEQDSYPVTASMIYLGKEETVSGGEFLYRSTVAPLRRNYNNEPFLLRSESLIRKVVLDLNFMVSFFKLDQATPIEVYDVPFKLSNIAPSPFPGNEFVFILVLIDGNHFFLEKTDEQGSIVKSKIFLMGDTVNFDAHQLRIDPIKDRDFSPYVGARLQVVLRAVNDVADEYIGKLTVRWAEEGAAILNLSTVGLIPQKEIDFIKSLVKNYQASDLDKKNQVSTRTSDFIKKQLSGISDSLNEIENQLQKFKTNNRIGGDLGAQAQRYLSKAEELDFKKLELVQNRNYYKYIEDYIGGSKDLGQVILPASLGLSDPVLNGLMVKISELETDLKLFLDQEKSEGNPLFRSRLNRVNELKRELLVAIANLRSTDKLKIEFIEGQLKNAEKEIGYIPLAQRQLISIQRNYSLLENLFVLLLTKKAEADINKASTVSEFAYVNEPRISGGSLKSSVERNLFIAFVFGLLLPIGVVVVIEFFNVTVQTKGDIERFTEIPIIGGVGHKKGKVNLEVLNFPSSMIAEAFRSLRSNLAYFTGKKEKVVFMVTSSISGEGKSFVSINLASILALSYKKTLLVGADLRKPRLHIEFGLPNNQGLSSFLAEIADFSAIVQSTTNEFLDFVASGPIPPNPAELLISPNFKKFIEKAQQEYDCIVIDTPPIGIISDAFPIVDFSDHILYLVRQKTTPKLMLNSVQDLYVKGKIKNVSILFNDIFIGLGASYTDAVYYAHGYEKGRKY